MRVLPPALPSAGAGPECKGRGAGFGREGLPAFTPPPSPRGWPPAPKLRRGGRTHVLSFHRPRSFLPPPPPPSRCIHPRSPPHHRRGSSRPSRPGSPLRCRSRGRGRREGKRRREEGKGGGGMAAGARRLPRHLLPPGPPPSPCTPAPLPLPPSSAPVPASSRRCRAAAAAAASKDEPGPTAVAGQIPSPYLQPLQPPSYPRGLRRRRKGLGKKRAPGGTRSPAGAAGHVGTEQRRSRKYRQGLGGATGPFDGLCRRPGTAASNF